MGKTGDIKSDVHAWDLLAFLVALSGRCDLCYAELRSGALSVLVGTCVVSSLVQYLGMFKEALLILEEIAPSLGDIRTGFAIDLEIWVRFRDDAAHIPDRTFRVALMRMHDAAVRDELGAGASVLAYDPITDLVSTGNDSSMVLGEALKTAGTIVQFLDTRLSADNKIGLIAKPSEARHREFIDTLKKLSEQDPL